MAGKSVALVSILRDDIIPDEEHDEERKSSPRKNTTQQTNTFDVSKRR